MNEQATQFNRSEPQSEVPAAALCLDATVELGERANDDTKTAPIRMRARTGDPIDHWWWGRVVHDLDGFELTGDKNRLALLYDHSEPIGYALRKNINTDSGDLELSGTLVETRNSNRATDVIDWMAAGVPFEASISFAGGTPKLEILEDGASAVVNGKTFEGPGVIVRQWKLREVSVVKSGADDGTESVMLSLSDKVPIHVMTQKEDTMSDENSNVVEDTDVKTLADSGDAITDDDSSEGVADTATQPVDEQCSQPAQKYFDAFGEQQGSWYFAHGVAYDDALAQELVRLRDENANLVSKVDAQALAGHDDGLSFSDGVKPKEGRDKEGKLTAIPVTYSRERGD